MQGDVDLRLLEQVILKTVPSFEDIEPWNVDDPHNVGKRFGEMMVKVIKLWWYLINILDLQRKTRNREPLLDDPCF